jgi:YhgE/Pip-like protein
MSHTDETDRTQHASRRRSPLLHPMVWALPTVVVLIVAATMAALYLGGILNPTTNITGFPVAVVNEDTGTTLPDGTRVDVGQGAADAIVDGVDPDQYAVQRLTLAEAQEQMDRGDLYGAIVLPADLSTDLVAYGNAAAAGESAEQPAVQVLTSPRVGSAAVGTVTRLGQSALDTVGQQTGEQLTTMVTQMRTAAGVTTPLGGLAADAVADPLSVDVVAHNPLPDGTGTGLSAFYYALLLVLAGFTGTIIANTFIDARLGFLPAEFGPFYRLLPHSGASRLATLVTKWVVMGLVALGVSAVYMAVAHGLGMPIDHPAQLWAFGAAAVFSVAVLAQALQAVLGNLGLLLNLFLFIVLALPSAGATMPLEMVPPFFRWLGGFEPMHQIYEGTRSILYFGATADSGLRRGLVAAAAFTVVGLVVGLVGTAAYDRRGLHRTPAPTGVHREEVREPVTAGR